MSAWSASTNATRGGGSKKKKKKKGKNNYTGKQKRRGKALRKRKRPRSFYPWHVMEEMKETKRLEKTQEVRSFSIE